MVYLAGFLQRAVRGTGEGALGGFRAGAFIQGIRKFLFCAAILLAVTHSAYAGALRHTTPQNSQVRTQTSATVPAITIPHLPRGPVLDDFLSMKPQGEIAPLMTKVAGFIQRNPHDGEAVT